MFYTETIHPPTTTEDHDLIPCKYSHYLSITAGVYTAVMRPIGVMKKPYKPCWAKVLGNFRNKGAE